MRTTNYSCVFVVTAYDFAKKVCSFRDSLSIGGGVSACRSWSSTQVCVRVRVACSFLDTPPTICPSVSFTRTKCILLSYGSDSDSRVTVLCSVCVCAEGIHEVGCKTTNAILTCTRRTSWRRVFWIVPRTRVIKYTTSLRSRRFPSGSSYLSPRTIPVSNPASHTHSHTHTLTHTPTNYSIQFITYNLPCVCAHAVVSAVRCANHREPSRFELITASPFRGLCNGVSSICAKTLTCALALVLVFEDLRERRQASKRVHAHSNHFLTHAGLDIDVDADARVCVCVHPCVVRSGGNFGAQRPAHIPDALSLDSYRPSPFIVLLADDAVRFR